MGTNHRHLVASAVESALRKSGRPRSWLAERSGIGREALDAKLRGDADFTIVDLANIAETLEVSASALTPSRRSSDE